MKHDKKSSQELRAPMFCYRSKITRQLRFNRNNRYSYYTTSSINSMHVQKDYNNNQWTTTYCNYQQRLQGILKSMRVHAEVCVVGKDVTCPSNFTACRTDWSTPTPFCASNSCSRCIVVVCVGDPSYLKVQFWLHFWELKNGARKALDILMSQLSSELLNSQP